MELKDYLEKIRAELRDLKYKPTHIYGIQEVNGVMYEFHGDHCVVAGQPCKSCDEENS